MPRVANRTRDAVLVNFDGFDSETSNANAHKTSRAECPSLLRTPLCFGERSGWLGMLTLRVMVGMPLHNRAKAKNISFCFMEGGQPCGYCPEADAQEAQGQGHR